MVLRLWVYTMDLLFCLGWVLVIVVVGFFIAIRKPGHYWTCPRCHHLNPPPESEGEQVRLICSQCRHELVPGWWERWWRGRRARRQGRRAPTRRWR